MFLGPNWVVPIFCAVFQLLFLLDSNSLSLLPEAIIEMVFISFSAGKEENEWEEVKIILSMMTFDCFELSVYNDCVLLLFNRLGSFEAAAAVKMVATAATAAAATTVAAAASGIQAQGNASIDSSQEIPTFFA